MPNAVAVIALSARGTMFDPGPVMYMEKLAGGEDIADLLDLDVPLGETVARVAERRGMDIRDVMVVTLDRPRHEEGMKAIRDAGARVRLITDGDVAGSLLAVSDRSPVSLLWGIGGTPEGVISSAAIKCIGGGFVGRLWPRDDDERKAALDQGYDLDKQFTQDDLVKGDDCFFSATGVTDGDVLQGVRYLGRTRDDGVDRHALALGHGAPGPRRAQPHEAARDHRRALRLSRRSPLPGRSSGSGSVGRAPPRASARRPTRDGARSRRASECRKPCVTSTWIRDWVCV